MGYPDIWGVNRRTAFMDEEQPKKYKITLLLTKDEIENIKDFIYDATRNLDNPDDADVIWKVYESLKRVK